MVSSSILATHLSIMILIFCQLIMFILKFSYDHLRGWVTSMLSRCVLLTSYLPFALSILTFFGHVGVLISMVFLFWWICSNPSRLVSTTNWGFVVLALILVILIFLCALPASPVLIFSALELLAVSVILCLLAVRLSLSSRSSPIIYLWPSALSGVLIFLLLIALFKPHLPPQVQVLFQANVTLKQILLLLAFSLKIGLLPLGSWLRDFYSSLGSGGLVVYSLIFYTTTIFLMVQFAVTLSVSASSTNWPLFFFLCLHAFFIFFTRLESRLSLVMFLGTASSAALISAAFLINSLH